MRLEYELNPTDLKEFQAAHSASAVKVPRRVVLPIWIGILVAAFTYGKLLSRYHDFDSTSIWLRIVLILIPMAAGLGSSIAVALVQVRGPLRYPWRTTLKNIPQSSGRRTWLMLLISLALIAYCIGMTYWLASLEKSDTDAAQEIAYDVGFIVLVIAMFLNNASLLILSKIRQRLYGWVDQRQLHGPHAAEVGESGVTINNPRSHLEYRWEAFAGFRETANLIILYLSPAICQILPKRATQDPQEMDDLRALLSGKIPEGHLLRPSSGFPVGHPPIPALPVRPE